MLKSLIIGVCMAAASITAGAAEFSVIRSYVYPVVIGQSTSAPDIQAVVSSGSAIVIAPGYAITAAHVVPATARELMSIHIKGKLVRATPVKIDRERDLALLSLNIGCPCAPLGEKVPEIDDMVYSVGFPLYLMYGVQFVTSGTVQGVFQGDTVTTSITAPGGSGGGLFAKEGKEYKLVGLSVAIASTPLGPRLIQLEQEHNWISFSVTVNSIRAFLKGTAASVTK